MNFTMDQILAFAIDHWPFVAAMAILAVAGQVIKLNILTKERAAKGRLWWWLRATLPLHPIAAGAVLGLIPGIPTCAALAEASSAARALYFAAAGMASAYFYAAVDRILLREGIHVPHPSAKVRLPAHRRPDWQERSKRVAERKTRPKP
jgi:hypothetical protein